MTGRQLVLDLPTAQGLTRADFLPAASNAAALAAIEAWRGWPGGRLLLRGPSGSGRTHLAAIWAQETGALWLSGATLALPALPEPGRLPPPAYAVDDADLVAGAPEREEALFHLLSRAQSDGAALLMTAAAAPGVWGLGLADLESRLTACAVALVDRPDDDLVRVALVKLFDDRQLTVAPETVDYLVPRIDRSLAAARLIVEALDRAALSRQKRISRALAAEILAGLGV